MLTEITYPHAHTETCYEQEEPSDTEAFWAHALNAGMVMVMTREEAKEAFKKAVRFAGTTNLLMTIRIEAFCDALGIDHPTAPCQWVWLAQKEAPKMIAERQDCRRLAEGFYSPCDDSDIGELEARHMD